MCRYDILKPNARYFACLLTGRGIDMRTHAPMSVSSLLQRLLDNRKEQGACVSTCGPSNPVKEGFVSPWNRLSDMISAATLAHKTAQNHPNASSDASLKKAIHPDTQQFLSLFPGFLSPPNEEATLPTGVARLEDYTTPTYADPKLRSAVGFAQAKRMERRKVPPSMLPFMPRAGQAHSLWSKHQLPPHHEWDLAAYILILDTAYPCKLCGVMVNWADTSFCQRGSLTVESVNHTGHRLARIETRHVITNEHMHLYQALKNGTVSHNAPNLAQRSAWWRLEPLAVVKMPDPFTGAVTAAANLSSPVKLHLQEGLVQCELDPVTVHTAGDLIQVAAARERVFMLQDLWGNVEFSFDILQAYKDQIIDKTVLEPHTDPHETQRWTLGATMPASRHDMHTDPLPFVPCVMWSQFFVTWYS